MMQRLFQIEFRHSYFSNGILKNSDVIPDKSTQNIINRFSLKLTMQDGIFNLYSPEQNNVNEFIKYLDILFDNTALRFTLIFNAESFSLTTDLPLSWVGQIELSSNKINNSDNSKEQLALIPQQSTREIFVDNAIGIISIYPKDLLAAGGSNIHYLVSFKARKTRWLYYLINRSQTKLHDPVISNEDGINFDNPETIVTPSGESALSFSSGTHKFSMQESPTELFNLVDRFSPPLNIGEQTIENTLIAGLPTPTNDQFRVTHENGDQQIYSTMYVYL